MTVVCDMGPLIEIMKQRDLQRNSAREQQIPE